MAECKRRPGARGGAAGDAISEIDAAEPSLPVASPQASPAVQRLISHIARGREIRVQRIAALKVAYGASRFADELSPAHDLRGGAIIALQVWSRAVPTSPRSTRWRASPGSRVHQ